MTFRLFEPTLRASFTPKLLKKVKSRFPFIVIMVQINLMAAHLQILFFFLHNNKTVVLDLLKLWAGDIRYHFLLQLPQWFSSQQLRLKLPLFPKHTLVST